MNTFIITGANSMVGKAVTRRFLGNGDRVIAVVRNPDQLFDFSEKENLRVIKCGMDNYHNLSDLINEKCDGFFHFAWAGTGGTGSDERLNLEIQERNIRNSMSAVFAARVLGCNCFIGAGSQAEYGICEGKITEDYPENPVTEYGKAKLAVKRMGLEYGRTVGMNFIWTRIFSAYGIGNSKKTMIMSVLRKMLDNEKVELTACTQMWDYINVFDVANAYNEIYLHAWGNEVYNIASGTHKPLKDFIYEMKNITNSKSELDFGSVPIPPTGHGFMPEIDRLKGIGWGPKVSFEEGIVEIVNAEFGKEKEWKNSKSILHQY